MTVFSSLFLKILPLYFIILLGYIAGKWLKVERESVASLLLYMVVPVVTFKGIYETQITTETLTYPIYFFVVGLLMSWSFFQIGKRFLANPEQAALLSLCSSLANVGYFGLPVAFMLFGPNILGITVLLILGLGIHESSFAFFIAARGKHNLKEALIKTLKLPTIYTSIAAVLANVYCNKESLTGLAKPIIEGLMITLDKFVGAYTVLGMLMVGLGLASITKIHFDLRFISLSFLAKFVVFPALALGFICLNKYFYFYDEQAVQIIFLMSIVPIGANTISIATELKMPSDTVSIAVVLSTFFALFYIPFAISWLF